MEDDFGNPIITAENAKTWHVTKKDRERLYWENKLLNCNLPCEP